MQVPTAFDWDDANEAKHLEKHGIPFSFAARVFLDENRLQAEDLRKIYAEARFNTVGLVDGICINVTFAMDGATARIISARQSSRKERKRYG
jgi:hypothetical protein